ncbi:MAG: NAD(P) transhydrogenase [Cellvibrionaceae bacterium]|jgi:NAD(P) transhydrogenase
MSDVISYDYDVVVIGSGPAGTKAAVQSAKLNKSVALIERDRFLGGACVHRATIPSKTLRENALRITHLRANARLSEDLHLTDNIKSPRPIYETTNFSE